MSGIRIIYTIKNKSSSPQLIGLKISSANGKMNTNERVSASFNLTQFILILIQAESYVQFSN